MDLAIQLVVDKAKAVADVLHGWLVRLDKLRGGITPDQINALVRFMADITEQLAGDLETLMLRYRDYLRYGQISFAEDLAEKTLGLLQEFDGPSGDLTALLALTDDSPSLRDQAARYRQAAERFNAAAAVFRERTRPSGLPGLDRESAWRGHEQIERGEGRSHEEVWGDVSARLQRKKTGQEGGGTCTS